MKLWSISTTVRNPNRLRNFLKVLKLIENNPFNKNFQIKYQILLIQHKFYKPMNIPSKYNKYYKKPELEIPYKIAEELFYHQNYTDPPIRGRQSVNPLNKLGFSIAKEKLGNIIITELGNQFLAGDYDIGYIFFKSLLKLQFPNPLSSAFTEKIGFDIMPLIATMHLINEVNQLSDKKGLTQTEFGLFVPSLINYNLINEYVQWILKYRRSKNKKRIIINFAKYFYGTNKPTKKQINNFFEYGDNTMRYFRLTRYFKVSTSSFGGTWRIDLEPTRQIEIEQLLKNYRGQSKKFKNKEKYLKYISDISLPKLPFEKIKNLREIAQALIININEFSISNKINLYIKEQNILRTKLLDQSKNNLEQLISKLREINLRIKEKQNRINLMTDFCYLEKIIRNLKNYKAIKRFSPEQFEKLIADTLKIINDEIKIKPNYPVDDNGEPISHASGDKPDIECYYKTFNAICEVTLDTSNFQWVRESQPVMRHFRNFENKNPNISNYCIFISPKIHQDTLYHFWISIKYGYDGSIQRIVPFSTEQFAILLETFLKLTEKNKSFTHKNIKILFNKIILGKNNSKGQIEWFNNIPKIIENWKQNLIT